VEHSAAANCLPKTPTQTPNKGAVCGSTNVQRNQKKCRSSVKQKEKIKEKYRKILN
jgi:hypothetical protein